MIAEFHWIASFKETIVNRNNEFRNDKEINISNNISLDFW